MWNRGAKEEEGGGWIGKEEGTRIPTNPTEQIMRKNVRAMRRRTHRCTALHCQCTPQCRSNCNPRAVCNANSPIALCAPTPWRRRRMRGPVCVCNNPDHDRRMAFAKRRERRRREEQPIDKRKPSEPTASPCRLPPWIQANSNDGDDDDDDDDGRTLQRFLLPFQARGSPRQLKQLNILWARR